MCGPSRCALESCTAESWERGRDLPGSATACRWRRARWFGSSPGWERTPNQEKLTGEEGLAPNWRVWHRESSGAQRPSRYSQESDYRTESLPLNTHAYTAYQRLTTRLQSNRSSDGTRRSFHSVACPTEQRKSRWPTESLEISSSVEWLLRINKKRCELLQILRSAVSEKLSKNGFSLIGFFILDRIRTWWIS